MARDQWQHWTGSPFYLKYYINAAPGAPTDAVLNLLEQTAVVPGERVLFAGCGTGESCLPIASKGFDVTGIEFAAGLVDAALEHEKENLHFFQHDLRLPFWSNYFRFAFLASTAFGHYDTRREHENVIRTIAGSLNPGGYFLLEYPVTAYHEQHPDLPVTKAIGDTTYEVKQTGTPSHYEAEIIVTDPSLSAPVHFFKQKEKFDLHTLEGMLASHGLEPVKLYGSKDLSPFDVTSSSTMYILARKTQRLKEDAEKRLYSDGRTTDALT